jgi:hypothetical protein
MLIRNDLAIQNVRRCLTVGEIRLRHSRRLGSRAIRSLKSHKAESERMKVSDYR